MIEFYHKHSCLFKQFNVNVDKAIISNGCFKTNRETIQRSMTPEVENDYTKYPSMKVIKTKNIAIKSLIRKLDIPTLLKCEKDDMEYMSFNLDTFPGFTYKEYFNCKTKRDAASIAHKVAIRRWKNIDEISKSNNKVLKRNYLFPSTYVIGARNKRDHNYDDNDELTSRPVHMPEFHCELNTSPWIDQITNHIKEVARDPIYIGNSFVNFDRLERDMQGSKTILEGDVRRFDSSVYISDIVIAVAICRLYYDLNDKNIDDHFIAIFDTVGIKDYYTWGLPLFDVKDPGSVMFELREARKSCAAGYIRVNAFNAAYGTESCVMFFIVNRPTNEPGFYLERQECEGRRICYTIKSYSVQANPEGGR